MNNEKLAVLIPCGGRGRRFGMIEKKPLVTLPDGNHPITNLLRDIPSEIPIYIYLEHEHKEAYERALGRNGNFGHRITYLIQNEDILYSHNGEPMIFSDGTYITASNGVATFINHFAKPPKYFFVIDGNRTGVFFPDVIAAMKMLDEDPELDAVVFAKHLNDEEIEEDIENQKKSRARWARVNKDEQLVYEYPCIPKEIIPDKNWHAIIGDYIFRAESLMRIIRSLKGELFEAECVDGIFAGKAYQLKMSMLLSGFNGREEGLSFEVYFPKRTFPNIKIPADLQRYLDMANSGAFDYRNKPLVLNT